MSVPARNSIVEFSAPTHSDLSSCLLLEPLGQLPNDLFWFGMNYDIKSIISAAPSSKTDTSNFPLNLPLWDSPTLDKPSSTNSCTDKCDKDILTEFENKLASLMPIPIRFRDCNKATRPCDESFGFIVSIRVSQRKNFGRTQLKFIVCDEEFQLMSMYQAAVRCSEKVPIKISSSLSVFFIPSPDGDESWVTVDSAFPLPLRRIEMDTIRCWNDTFSLSFGRFLEQSVEYQKKIPDWRILQQNALLFDVRRKNQKTTKKRVREEVNECHRSRLIEKKKRHDDNHDESSDCEEDHRNDENADVTNELDDILSTSTCIGDVSSQDPIICSPPYLLRKARPRFLSEPSPALSTTLLGTRLFGSIEEYKDIPTKEIDEFTSGLRSFMLGTYTNNVGDTLMNSLRFQYSLCHSFSSSIVEGQDVDGFLYSFRQYLYGKDVDVQKRMALLHSFSFQLETCVKSAGPSLTQIDEFQRKLNELDFGVRQFCRDFLFAPDVKSNLLHTFRFILGSLTGNLTFPLSRNFTSCDLDAYFRHLRSFFRSQSESTSTNSFTVLDTLHFQLTCCRSSLSSTLFTHGTN